MSYTYAGTYGPTSFIDTGGRPLVEIPITVLLHGTSTLASLYTDRTKATLAANPASTDEFGNLTFFADPGEYDISGNGQVLSGIILPVDPAETLMGDTEGTFGSPTVLEDTPNVTSILEEILAAGVTGADLINAVLSGTTQAPTQTPGDNSTSIATTAFVASAVQTAAGGLQPKASVVVIATANQALTGLPTIDGVTLTAGQRVLLTGQTSGSPLYSDNGIWTVASGAWSRPSDFAHGSTQQNTFVVVTSGTVGSGQGWVLSGSSSITVDTTAETWVLFSSAVVGALLAANNLSDVVSKPSALSNIGGQPQWNTAVKGSSYVAVVQDEVFTASPVTTPTATTTGQRFRVFNTSTSALVVVTAAAGTILGNATLTLAPKSSAELVWNNSTTDWGVI